MNEEIFSSNMIMEGMAELVLNTGNQTDLEVHSGKNTLDFHIHKGQESR